MSPRRSLPALLLLVAACAAAPPATPAPAPASAPQPAAAPPAMDEHQQTSYTVGYDVGHNLLAAKGYLDRASLLQGLEDGWQRRQPRYAEAAMRQVMSDVATQLRSGAATPPPGSDIPARFCYAMGVSISNNLYPVRDQLDFATLEQTVGEGLDGKPPLLDDATRSLLSNKLREEVALRRHELGLLNQQKSDAFLAANRGRPGVNVTASGLQYQVLSKGRGPRPPATGAVTIHYSGSLLDGTAFDDQHRQGQAPARFPLGAMIPGFGEGLQLMPAGSVYRLWLPPQLGYGEAGAGSRIGPNQVLVFDVELLKVE